MAETADAKRRRKLREVADLTTLAKTSIEKRDKLIVALHAEGETPTHIGVAAGLSRVRVHQIIKRETKEDA